MTPADTALPITITGVGFDRFEKTMRDVIRSMKFFGAAMHKYGGRLRHLRRAKKALVRSRRNQPSHWHYNTDGLGWTKERHPSTFNRRKPRHGRQAVTR